MALGAGVWTPGFAGAKNGEKENDEKSIAPVVVRQNVLASQPLDSLYRIKGKPIDEFESKNPSGDTMVARAAEYFPNPPARLTT